MLDCEYIFNCKYQDLNPRCFGKMKAKNESQLANLPFIMCGIIHYVESGSGTLIKNGKKYKVSTGDILVFSIGDAFRYEINKDDPLTMVYIEFDGNLCEDFKNLPDVFRDEDIFLKDFDKIASYNGNKAALIASFLLKLHSNVVSEKKPPENDYVKFTKTYIKENYMKDIKVEDIAAMLGISRFHLLRVFKRETAMTVQEYLIAKRVGIGRRFIEKGKNITEAAYLCGFASVASFSRCYKSLYKCPPSQYKNKITRKI